MNPSKRNAYDYIQFLISTQNTFSAVEAARTHPEGQGGSAPDTYTRLLYRTESNEDAVWQEAQQLVDREQGILIVDDSTLDKPNAQALDLVTYHWSGKHQDVVKGINLISLLWTDTSGEKHVLCDFRIYDRPNDGLTKNDHFRAMIRQAAARGFAPELVAFDSWYAALDNLKLLRSLDWAWMTRLRSNRSVDPDGEGNRPISEIDIPPAGRQVHLKGYGWVKVFRPVGKDGDVEYWATSCLDMPFADQGQLTSAAR